MELQTHTKKELESTKKTDKEIGQIRQKLIMEHLQKWEYSTIKLMAKLLGLTYLQTFRNVQNLQKKGFVHEEKFLKTNANYLIFLTDIGLAKILGDAQVSINNEKIEVKQKRLQERLEQNQMMEITATKLDKTNISLIKHNLYLQFFYDIIKKNLQAQGFRIISMQNERELLAQTRFDRKNIAKQAQLDLIIARKTHQSPDIIRELEAISREKENDYRTSKGKFSDILITVLSEQGLLTIALELEMSLKKDRELDHMFYEYDKLLTSNKINKVIIGSPMSLNPYIRYFNNTERFAIHKYSGKLNRYEIIDMFTMSTENKTKFDFRKVQIDDSII